MYHSLIDFSTHWRCSRTGMILTGDEGTSGSSVGEENEQALRSIRNDIDMLASAPYNKDNLSRAGSLSSGENEEKPMPRCPNPRCSTDYQTGTFKCIKPNCQCLLPDAVVAG